MAGKSVLKKHGDHKHCAVCGTCFIAGINKDIHRCPQPIDRKVLEVFILDSNRLPARGNYADGTGDVV